MTDEFPFIEEMQDEIAENAAKDRRKANVESLQCCWPDWKLPTKPEHLHGVRKFCSVGETCVKAEQTGEAEYQYSAPCKILEIKDDGNTYRVAIDYPEDAPEHCKEENGRILLLDLSEIWAPVDILHPQRSPGGGMHIKTHHAKHLEEDEDPWLAIDMNLAQAILEGYELTEDEKTDVGAIMAGYCRLLDEADVLGYGKTKEEAMDEAAEKSLAHRQK